MTVYKFYQMCFALIAVVALLPSSSLASDCGDQKKCIFVLGNSITRHGPSPKISWVGDWGMAASAPEKDYTNQLISMLTEKSVGEKWCDFRQSANVLESTPEKFRLPYHSVQFAKTSDVVVVALGDNFNLSASNVNTFSEVYLDTLKTLHPLNGVMVCVGTWWTSPQKNKIIQDNCRLAGGLYVDISGLSDIPENVAGNQQNIANKGVAAHPGDKGMKAIAERIFNTIRVSGKYII